MNAIIDLGYHQQSTFISRWQQLVQYLQAVIPGVAMTGLICGAAWATP